MVDRVELRDVRVFAEPHLGTPAGPADPARRRWVELSHVISDGHDHLPRAAGPGDHRRI